MTDDRVTRLTLSQARQADTSRIRLLVPFRIRDDQCLSSSAPQLLPEGCAAEDGMTGDGVLQLAWERGDAALSSTPLSHLLAPAVLPCDPVMARWLPATLLLMEDMQRRVSAQALCRQLADAVLQALTLRETEGKPLRHTGRNTPAAMVEETRRYVEGHCSEDLSLQRMAGQLFVTPSYLSRIFHRWTGSTFIAFVQETRLKKARELLSSSSLSVTEIATATGLGTSSHLSSLFRRAYGVSPNSFRREAVKNRYLHGDLPFPR